MTDETGGPVRMTKTFVHDKTNFSGAKKASDVADVAAFCLDAKIPGKLVITMPGNGGITSVVYESKDTAVRVMEEDSEETA